MEQPEQVHPRAVSAETLVGRKQAKLPVKLPAVIADQVVVRPGDPVLLPELFLPVVVEKHPEPAQNSAGKSNGAGASTCRSRLHLPSRKLMTVPSAIATLQKLDLARYSYK